MTDTDTLRDVLSEVEIERVRQDGLWGEQNHSPAVWLMILGEEVGEATEAALEAWANDPSLYPKSRDQWLGRYRAELIQVAAVAVAMVESLDRNKLADADQPHALPAGGE